MSSTAIGVWARLCVCVCVYEDVFTNSMYCTCSSSGPVDSIHTNLVQRLFIIHMLIIYTRRCLIFYFLFFYFFVRRTCNPLLVAPLGSPRCVKGVHPVCLPPLSMPSLGLFFSLPPAARPILIGIFLPTPHALSATEDDRYTRDKS